METESIPSQPRWGSTAPTLDLRLTQICVWQRVEVMAFRSTTSAVAMALSIGLLGTLFRSIILKAVLR